MQQFWASFYLYMFVTLMNCDINKKASILAHEC